VLLVDDSPIIRRILRTLFECAGIGVCGEAEDGAQAIEKADQLKPDLIVLDLAMPVMNGLQATPILKKMLPQTPIILFTLYADSILEDEAFVAGVNSLIRKNEAISLLIDEANSLLKR
jgi:CheY-like chemotaxis protein